MKRFGSPAEGIFLLISGAVLVYLFFGVNIFNVTISAVKIFLGVLGVILVLRGLKMILGRSE